jgi:hypothetical protein
MLLQPKFWPDDLQQAAAGCSCTAALAVAVISTYLLASRCCFWLLCCALLLDQAILCVTCLNASAVEHLTPGDGG